MSIELSICIPTYNRGNILRETIESIIAQAEQDIEIVISDNGSADDTQEIVKELQRRFARLNYFRWDKNVGPDRNFLKAIEMAQGTYCWFLGSDDILTENAIDIILAEIKNNTADIYFLNKQGFDYSLKNERPTYSPLSKLNDTKIIFGEKNILICKVLSSLGYIGSLCFRKSLWDSIDPREYEKYLGSAYIHVYMIQRLIKRGWVVKYLSFIFIKWRFGDDSILREHKAIGRLRIEVNYINITKDVFGDRSFEAKFVANEFIKQYIFYLILRFKVEGRSINTMFCIVWRQFRTFPLFYVKIIPLFIMPTPILKFLRFLYGRTIKRNLLRKLRS